MLEFLNIKSIKHNLVIRRIKGLVYKEILQIFRDPSSLLIAFILPAIFLLLCGYGMSLDVQNIKLGIVMEDSSPTAQNLVRAFINSKYYDVKIDRTQPELEKEIITGKIKAFIVIPQKFSQNLKSKDSFIPVQLITDGSDPNTAKIIQNYTQSVLQNWLMQELYLQGQNKLKGLITIEPRIWFNSELRSSNTIIPGVIAIAMALVGTLLTSLVVAREWERGTMESLMTTPVSVFEILMGKILPYFTLGMISMILTTFASILMFDVPFKGSIFWLLILSSAFMITSIFFGLLISTISKNQFVAAVISLVAVFLPTVMLSGFVFEISSMPLAVRMVSYLFPAQYFVSGIRTLFLAGNIPKLFITCMLQMLLIGSVLFFITAKKTVKRLD